ncbi:L-fucose/L-arabinose isomerase family protein [Sorangium sp. So ce693]|uniref:L-fucose/L-arabinose isomerase family protein n=1 Tax=Sorangium sp. So ce693 TaxID=3133318 RepID=UPI003F5EA2B2
MAQSEPVILGFMGNRGFFPTEFAEEGAKATQSAVGRVLGERVRYVDLGNVETYADARAAAGVAQQYRRDPDGGGAIGVICSMYNFSDENGIRDFLRLADLDVPVLLHTEPDVRGLGRMGQKGRRDGACGRFSAANALRHIGYPYTLTSKHCEAVSSAAFADDLHAFYASCVVASKFRRRGRGVRLGLVGSGPDAFQTVTNVSTELLGHIGLSTVGLELIALDRQMRKVSPRELSTQLEAVSGYMAAADVPRASLEAIARMGVVFDRFVKENDLDGIAVRCWTEMQKYQIGGEVGVMPCTCMSMLSDKLIPAACETDIAGWMGMYMLQCASGLVPLLGDWNNMYDDEREEVDLFHCGVWAKSVMRPGARITRQEILATQADIGAENTWGAVDGELKAGTCAFLRPCTNAREGSVFLYGGVGRVSEEGIDTFGTRGRIHIPRIQELFRYLTQPERAVEHHTALVVGTHKNIGLTMKAIRDAVPYINAQAGLGRGGQALVDFHEHSQVGEL